ncbi:MAG: PAS domain-containing sensor histidine kinase [Anaerohalosphaera sp.]|nr:PAS domain-containing sensor histidine kinase [Anaerohalosphaera sp.]
MEQTLVDTYFAPAERAPEHEILSDFERASSLQFLTSALEAMPHIVFLLNEQRQIVFANKVFCQAFDVDNTDSVLGLRPGEAIECTNSNKTIGGCGTTENCKTCGAVLAILNSIQGNTDEKECRIIRRHDCQAFDLKVKAAPLMIGKKQFTILSAVDISHEKRRRILERVFFHDIMNTIAGIKGISELLSDLIPKRQKDAKSYTTAILRGAVDLIENVRAQKDLTDAEKNELVVTPTQVNSKTILADIQDIYKSHPVTKNRTIEICPSTQNVDFVSDITLLRRCLGNLTKNAIEASGSDDTITIGCKIELDRLQFWVHNPTVIPAEIQQQIFQRSFSTKGNDRGLGTYSIKLFVEKYIKGTIEFTSNENEKTTFKLSLPLNHP